MRSGTRMFAPILVGLFLVVAASPLGSPASVAAASTELYFSEYIEGSSNNKALEIYNDTGAAVNLSASGYRIEMFFNGNTSPGLTINLTGTVANGDVYVLAHSSASHQILAVADQTNGAGWFNGDDAVVLRKGPAVIDSIGQVGFDPGSEWGTGNASTADNTLERKATVTGGDTNASDPFAPSAEWNGYATDTFDGLGSRSTAAWSVPGDCDDPYTAAYDIQGSGTSSPMYRDRVTTQGIVVGDFQGPISAGLEGFFIQDTSGDSDTATSDGIFVFTGATDHGLHVNDVVRVQGTVGEFFGQTELLAKAIVDCGTSGAVAPVDVTLPVPALSDLERYEGMFVRLPQDLVIAEYFNYDRFGELVLALPLAGESRPFTPTSIEEPGSAEYFTRLDANLRSRITLDDGLGSQNPQVTRHPNGAPFSLTNRFRGGDIVGNAVGALGFGFGVYRIQPTAPAYYTAANSRLGAPDSVGGNLQVASFNMLNFFLTLDTTTSDSGPGPCGGTATLDCRGADSNQPGEFGRQRDKLLAALAGLDAEIVGVNEIENTPGVDPLGDPARGIVPGLNAMLGAGTYDYVDTGVIGTDAIRVGLIYRPGVVTPLGDFEILDSSDDPRFDEDRSRPMLTQTFVENATGAVFTVAVNHLKSKGSSCGAGDDDTVNGQGNCNLTRTLAAQAIVDWLATDPTGSDDPDFLIIGDLNAYAQEAPIDTVRAGADDTLGTGDDFTNLAALYGGTYAYSYVFDGMAGYLDHALGNNSMTAQVTGATDWHINADEPDLIDYDTSFKSNGQDAIYAPDQYRSSDHDPVLVGLALTPDVGKVTGSGTWADGSFDVSVDFNPSSQVPTGSTTLAVDAGTLVSDGYEWLSVNGKRAFFQGTGSLDGVSGYGFLIAVADGGSPGRNDRIRVRIWDSLGNTVYDSQAGSAVNAGPTAALTSGNLEVHKVK